MQSNLSQIHFWSVSLSFPSLHTVELTKSISHHLRKLGNDKSAKYQRTLVPHRFLGGAKWILSIHSTLPIHICTNRSLQATCPSLLRKTKQKNGPAPECSLTSCTAASRKRLTSESREPREASANQRLPSASAYGRPDPSIKKKKKQQPGNRCLGVSKPQA